MDIRRFPLWVSNLAVFAALFVFVNIYFLWQTGQARKAFTEHMTQNARLAAKVIRLNAQGAVAAKKVIEEILRAFLENSARFVDFLDGIEPFTADELSSFAKETGLAGISIARQTGSVITGPRQWTDYPAESCTGQKKLLHLGDKHLYLFIWPRREGQGCIHIGLDAREIESLQAQMSLEHVTRTISKLAGICYVKTEPQQTTETRAPDDDPRVSLVSTQDGEAAEFCLQVDNTRLTVGIRTDYLMVTLHHLRRDFILFSCALALLGGALSLLLYRQQTFHLNRTRQYERALSREREDAALGRAAAAIAHEIRNPLNALKMGLQRLQLEAPDLSPEHLHLVELMLDSVRRANTTVGSLLTYARPQAPRKKRCNLAGLVDNVLEPYLVQCAKQGIQVDRDIRCHDDVMADPDLMHHAVENLLRNALEAQPGGGFIRIELGRTGKDIVLTISNGGCTLSAEDRDRMPDPYFTTKEAGTGLGLSIARRIIAAHEGRMTIAGGNPGTIAISIYLPASCAPAPEETAPGKGRT